MTRAPLVAILDDEPEVRRMLQSALDEAGFRTVAFARATEFEAALNRVTPDVCLVDLGLAQFKVGHQQRILQPLHQFRGEHGVAGGTVLDRRVQRGAELAEIDLGVLQRSLQQTAFTFEQAEQQVFDEDLAAAASDAALGAALQVTAAVGIQGLYELLQVYVDHVH